jgi:hypothetical protein
VTLKQVETEETSGYNAIKAIYQLLALRVGSAKAIVATARKMVEVLYHISLTETHFRRRSASADRGCCHVRCPQMRDKTGFIIGYATHTLREYARQVLRGSASLWNFTATSAPRICCGIP